MRMAIRGTATATALALVWAAAVGCSSRGQKAQSAADAAPVVAPAPAPSPAAANAPATAKITGTAFAEDADGARVVLSANAPLLYTSYEPRPNLLVVDLRDAVGRVQRGDAQGRRAGRVDQVRGARRARQADHPALDHAQPRRPPRPALGRPGPGDRLHRTHGDGGDCRRPGRRAGRTAAAWSRAPAAATAPAARRGRVRPAPKPAPVSVARGEAAHALESVTAQTKDGKVAIVLLGDGWFSAKDFALANPPRIVVDLPGVKNEVKQRTIVVKDDVVTRVRISQFQTSPEYVTRVVVDLARPMPHALVPDGERLAVVVGENASAETMAQVAEEPAVTAARDRHRSRSRSGGRTPGNAGRERAARRPRPSRRSPRSRRRTSSPGGRGRASASGPRPACRAAGSRSKDHRGRPASAGAGPGRRCARSRGRRRARAEARPAGPQGAASASRRRPAATRSSKPRPPSSTRISPTRRRAAAPRTARARSRRPRASSRVSRSRSTSRTPTSRTSSGRSPS